VGTTGGTGDSCTIPSSPDTGASEQDIDGWHFVMHATQPCEDPVAQVQYIDHTEAFGMVAGEIEGGAAAGGSRIEIDVAGRTRTDWVTLDTGFAAATPPVVHFGLGDAKLIDELQVTLPQGGQVVTLPGPLAGRRRVTVSETARPAARGP
jgi:hypothetical protein